MFTNSKNNNDFQVRHHQQLSNPFWKVLGCTSGPLSVGHSVQFSCSVVSDSLRPHELQHDRPPCPSSTPEVYPNSCPLNWWCHLAISSSVVPVSFCPQSLPASGSFPMSQLLASGGQSIGVSASALVLPMNTQEWSSLGWTGWISLQSKGTLKSLLQHHSSKASILQHSLLEKCKSKLQWDITSHRSDGHHQKVCKQ